MTFRRMYTARRRPQLLLEGAPASAEVEEERAMASNGIKDRVAIVGMGCTQFGEHWDKGAERSADRRRGRGLRARPGIDPDAGRRLLARHHGQRHLGPHALRCRSRSTYKPVTRLENMCATGSEAMRNAGYAVASRRLRPRDGDRRREAQGLGLLGSRRHRARPNDGTAPEHDGAGDRSRCSRPPTPRSTASTRASSRT